MKKHFTISLRTTPVEPGNASSPVPPTRHGENVIRGTGLSLLQAMKTYLDKVQERNEKIDMGLEIDDKIDHEFEDLFYEMISDVTIDKEKNIYSFNNMVYKVGYNSDYTYRDDRLLKYTETEVSPNIEYALFKKMTSPTGFFYLQLQPWSEYRRSQSS